MKRILAVAAVALCLGSQILAQTIVEVRPPTVFSPTSAELRGELLSAIADTSVYFVYGPADYGSTDMVSWPFSVFAGIWSNPVPFSITVTNLMPDTEYFYRIVTTNSFDGFETWSAGAAPVTNFWTMSDTGGDFPYFKISGIPDAVLVGEPQTFTVEAWFGANPMTNYTGTVFFASQYAETDLPTDYSFMPSDNGIRTFTNAVIFNKLGQFNQLQVQDSMDSGMHGKQRDILAYAGYTDKAEKLIVWNYPWRSYTGEWHSVSVAAVDRNMNLATNYTGTIDFSSTDIFAILPSGGAESYTFSMLDGGWKTFTGELQWNTMGIHSLTVVDRDNAAIWNTQWDIIAMGHGISTQATHLVVSGRRYVTVGETNQIQVMVHNEFEQMVTDFTGLVNFYCSDTNAIYPSSYFFVSTDNGYVSLVNALTFYTPGTHSFTAELADNATIQGILGPIEVSDNTPFSEINLHVEVTPVTIVGQSGDITVKAVDAHGVIITNHLGGIAFESSDLAATFPSASYDFTTNDFGIMTFTNALAWGSAGEQHFIVYDVDNPVTRNEQDVVVFAPGDTNTVGFEIYLGEEPAIAGQAHDVIIVALGSDGRVNTNYQGPISFNITGGGSFAQNPTSNVFENGIAFLPNQLTPTASGQQTLSAEQTDATLVRGETPVLVVGGEKRFVDAKYGSDTNDGMTPGSAWKTLMYAVPLVQQGQILIIAPGRYTSEIHYNGANAPGLTTTFHGDTSGRFFGRRGYATIAKNDPGPAIILNDQNDITISRVNIIYPSATPGHTGVVIRASNNITLFDGAVWYAEEKGIYIENSPNVTLGYCMIEKGGIGIYAIGNSPGLLIEHTDVEGNTGGGIALYYLTGAQIVRSWIGQNGGHGIAFYGSQGSIRDVRIKNNIGNGIYVESVGGSALIERSLVASNAGAGIRFLSADNGSEVLHSVSVYNQSGLLVEAGQPVSVRNSIVYQNTNTGIEAAAGGAVSNRYNTVYGNAPNWAGNAIQGEGEIEVDPLFASGEDFHLQSMAGRYTPGGWVTDAATSPCIDAGDPADPFGNEPEPNGGRVNIGIYGGTREASLSPLPADIEIVASAGMGGSIAPSGSVWVAYGSNMTFTITADTGYSISDVWIDGTNSVGPTNSYTFLNVTNSGHSIAASFDLNLHTLSVDSQYGLPMPDRGTHTNTWGTAVNAWVEPFIDSFPTQYVNTGWAGTGSVPATGSSNAVDFVHEADSTISWLWGTNYWLDIGMHPDGTADLTSDWYAAGSSNLLTATANSNYIFTGWTGDITSTDNPLTVVMDTPLSVQPNFVPADYEIVASAGVSGSIAPSGSVWVANGSNMTFTITADTGYSISDVSIDGMLIGPTNSYTFLNVTNSGHSIAASFDLNLHTLSIDSQYGLPMPVRGTHTNTWGTAVNAWVEPFIDSFPTQYVNTGWAGTGSVPATGSSNQVDFVQEADSTLSWLWGTNYWLDIGTHPDGTADLTSDWYPANSSNLLTATANSNHIFTGWTGDIVTNANPLTVVMDTPLSVQPNFVPADYDITATAYTGGSISPSGSVWVAYGSNMTFTITADTGYSISDVWINGSAIGPTNSYTFLNVTNSGHSIAASFSINQYTLTFDSAGGSAIAPITQDFGAAVTAPADPAREGYTFADWDPPLPTTMPASNQPHTAQWTIEQFTLLVESIYGTPNPPAGSNTYAWGTSVEASVDAVVLDGTATRHLNAGWTGSGSVPASDPLNPVNTVNVVITNHSTITWLWDTEHWLEIPTEPNGTVDTISQWVPEGSNVTLLATASANYSFAGWIGDVPLAATNDNPLTLTMDQPRAVSPRFLSDFGGLRVTINYGAAAAGARWRLTTGVDTTWQESGNTLTGLPVAGSPYAVEFNTILFFETPAIITGISLNPGQIIDISARYNAQMASIAGGTFDMGISTNSAGHPVQLSSFRMDVQAVTIGQFTEFAQATGVTMPQPPIWGGNTTLTWATLSPELPMVNVTWNQAKAYASWAGKRLPTEAEYEFAMRSGLTNQPYPWGDNISAANANYDNSIGQPTVAGSYPVNAFGLYDIAGNVWEWCSDWYAFIPQGGDLVMDPQGPGAGTYKMTRGGSFFSQQPHLQTHLRSYYTPDARTGEIGFRCATDAVPIEPSPEPIPAWWVEWHFGDGSGNEKAAGFNPAADSDSDGMTDGDEFLAGTDPNDSDSVLALTSHVTMTEAGVYVEWKSVDGRIYALQRSTNLIDGFLTVQSGIQATTPLSSYTDQPEGNGPWFYRVLVE